MNISFPPPPPLLPPPFTRSRDVTSAAAETHVASCIRILAARGRWRLHILLIQPELMVLTLLKRIGGGRADGAKSARDGRASDLREGKQQQQQKRKPPRRGPPSDQA